MATREYLGDGITVHWDSERCIHSERCTTGLPAVFDRGRRPWVLLAGTPADEVAAVVDTCPSGALTYTRTDGAPNGRRGREAGDDPAVSLAPDPAPDASAAAEPAGATIAAAEPAVVTIRPLADGPYSVIGPVTIDLADGSTVTKRRCSLCRCGQSQSKPFCDGSHARAGFRAAGV